MSKYINADEYRKVLNGESDERTYCINENAYDDGLDRGLGIAIDILDEMPSADVVEVKRGEWENKLPDGWQCSECFEIIPLKFMTMFCWGGNRMNFCPRCGADMRERKETDDRQNQTND